MLGLGIAFLIIGYSLVYTGVSNLKNGGQGPGLFESMGFSGTLDSPANKKGSTAQGSGLQSGNTPQYSADLATPTNTNSGVWT